MAQISENIIIRFINNNCTDEELAAVKDWLEESGENADLLFETEQTALHAAMLRKEGTTRERLEAKIKQRIEAKGRLTKRKNKLRFVKRFSAVAAVLAVILVSAFFVFRLPNVKMVHVAAADESISLTLPDSTVVYLNKNSSLSYPETFASDRREVELSGEGYFEVSHDKNRPFKVKGQYLQVEVLGTHFNFVSKDSVHNNVSLLEGSVEVLTVHQKDGVVLEPGQKASYSASTGHLTVHDTNANADAAWHDKMILFENANLQEIVKILDQLYEIEIVLDSNADLAKTYSGATFYCDEIDTTLTRLSNTVPIEFASIDGKMVIYSR